MIFYTRYWLSRFLMSATLAVMPPGRYRDELIKVVYELRDRCIREVTEWRAQKTDAFASVLSERPDGAGYYYGFIADDRRQINVRCGPVDLCWRAFVGGVRVGDVFNNKQHAEAAALIWIKTHPKEIE